MSPWLLCLLRSCMLLDMLMIILGPHYPGLKSISHHFLKRGLLSETDDVYFGLLCLLLDSPKLPPERSVISNAFFIFCSIWSGSALFVKFPFMGHWHIRNKSEKKQTFYNFIRLLSRTDETFNFKILSDFKVFSCKSIYFSSESI